MEAKNYRSGNPPDPRGPATRRSDRSPGRGDLSTAAYWFKSCEQAAKLFELKARRATSTPACKGPTRRRTAYEQRGCTVRCRRAGRAVGHVGPFWSPCFPLVAGRGRVNIVASPFCQPLRRHLQATSSASRCADSFTDCRIAPGERPEDFEALIDERTPESHLRRGAWATLLRRAVPRPRGAGQAGPAARCRWSSTTRSPGAAGYSAIRSEVVPASSWTPRPTKMDQRPRHGTGRRDASTAAPITGRTASSARSTVLQVTTG